jgi:hypothetical protein
VLLDSILSVKTMCEKDIVQKQEDFKWTSRLLTSIALQNNLNLKVSELVSKSVCSVRPTIQLTILILGVKHNLC